MFVPGSREKLNSISEIVAGEIEGIVERGGTYDNDDAYEAAARAVRTIMPELVELSGERVAIEAYRAVGIEEEQKTKTYSGMFTQGVLRSIVIQQLVSEEMLDDIPIDTTMHDLCAVVVPRYADSDPGDIVFSQVLYVPFGTVTKFEAA